MNCFITSKGDYTKFGFPFVNGKEATETGEEKAKSGFTHSNNSEGSGRKETFSAVVYFDTTVVLY